MNRHHPYAGNFDGAQRGGPGFDRPLRGAPRGRGRGRGRGGMNNAGAYDGGPPGAPYEYSQPSHAPPSDSGYYSQYGAPPPQEQAYGNGQYGGPPAAPPPATPVYAAAPNGYDQLHQGYEDAPSSRPQYDYGSYNAPDIPPRDEKVHESLINDRVSREKPCRTLFIRNIKYETNPDDVRRTFEEHGEVKTFFDLIGNRGMIFVTYYDLRAAERARGRLQNSEIAGRPIDVHYSLPRDEENSVEMQGTVVVTLRNSMQPIDDNELRRRMQPMGDIKAIRPLDSNRPDERCVEFYDLRACDMAFDRLQHQGLQDGIMEIAYGWSDDDKGGPKGGLRRGGNIDRGGRDWDESPRGRRSRGGRGRRGRGGYTEEPDRRREWDSRNDGGFGPGRGHDRFDGRGPGGYDGPPPVMPAGPNGYGPTPSALPYRDTHLPAPPASQGDDRLEQAKKVQQLLAALKQPPVAAPSPAAPTAAPAGPPAMPYYGQPPAVHAPAGYPGAQNPYAAAPAITAAPAPYGNNEPFLPQAASRSLGSIGGSAPGATAALPSQLPPNVLAMLQQVAQSQPAVAGMYPGMAAYGAPAPTPPPRQQPVPAPGGPGPAPGQPTYEQLRMLFQNQAAAAHRQG